jgi:hypothetical protein
MQPDTYARLLNAIEASNGFLTMCGGNDRGEGPFFTFSVDGIKHERISRPSEPFRSR